MGAACSSLSTADTTCKSPGDALRRAVCANDIGAVRTLLNRFPPGVLLHDSDALTKRTALHEAIVRGRLEMTAMFVARGLVASHVLRQRDAAGDSALDLAVWKGSISAAQLLLAARVSVECAPFGQRGWSPVHVAAYLDDQRMVHLLCSSLTQSGLQDCVATTSWDTPLHVAARRNALKAVSALIERGASVRAPNKSHLTPLHVACLHGATASVRVLAPAAAAQGALDSRNASGHTPLHYAARVGDTGSCRALVVAGADVNVRSADGETAVYLAAREGRVETVKFLVREAAACIDARLGPITHSALHVAAAANRVDIVAALLSQQDSTSDIDVRDGDGRTALHVACSANHSDVATELLSHGASALATDASGHTALWAAQEAGAAACCAALAGCAQLNVSVPEL
jgi:ankyrin repeat protein